MFPVPDLSYFALPGFLATMRRRPVHSASLILHDGGGQDWDEGLAAESGSLYTRLHQYTGNLHDVYLPFTLNDDFRRYHRDHLIKVVQPARDRIRTYLERLGVTDIEDYMADSDEWLDMLFADRASHYAAARIGAAAFGIATDELPAIVLWTTLDARSVIVLQPHKQDASMEWYIEAIYSAITASTSTPASRSRTSLAALKDSLKGQLEQSSYLRNRPTKVRYLDVISTEHPVSDLLYMIGEEYGQQFEMAILAFEEYVHVARPERSFIQFTNARHQSLVSELTAAGFQMIRQGGRHEIWGHPNTDEKISLPRHKKISPFITSRIRQQIRATVSDVA
jgi:predicted RNA binding protein YcfA (HicA-like mRNA interferase family)